MLQGIAMSDMLGGGETEAGSAGFIYSFDIHMGIGRGPVDAVVECRVGGKLGWQGNVTESSVNTFHAPNLFGGLKKEGGISGFFHAMFGEVTQVASDALKALCAPTPTPGFRRMMTIHYTGQVCAVNPYPKPWSWRIRRALKGWDGDPLAPDTAVIMLEGQITPPDAVAVPPIQLVRTSGGFAVPIAHPYRLRLLTEFPSGGGVRIVTAINSVLAEYPPSTGLFINIPYNVTFEPDGSASLDVPPMYAGLGISAYIDYTINGSLTSGTATIDGAGFPNPVSVIVPPGPGGGVVTEVSTVVGEASPGVPESVPILGTTALPDGTMKADINPKWFNKVLGVTRTYALPLGGGVTTWTSEVLCNEINTPARITITAPNNGIMHDVEGITTTNDSSLNDVDFQPRNVPFVYEGHPLDEDDVAILGQGVVAIHDTLSEGKNVSIRYAYEADLTGGDPSVNLIPFKDIHAMNPAHIIYECLTNREWGRGYQRSVIDTASFEACAVTLKNEGFGLCLRWARRDDINSFIQNVLDHVAGTLRTNRSTALLELKLIRGDYVKSSLKLWDTSNGILTISDNSVNTSAVIVNEIIVKYKDPVYNEIRTVNEQNLASLQSSGGAFNTITKEYLGIPIPALARRVALRDLKAQAEGLRKFKITVDRRGWDLTPGDVMRIQDIPRMIPDTVVRIARAEDGTLVNGTITLDVVTDVFTLPATSFTQEQPNTWLPTNFTPCIGDHEVFELPYYLISRLSSAAAFAALTDTSAYLGTVAELAQPMNVTYTIAVKTGAPDSSEIPTPEDQLYCGYTP